MERANEISYLFIQVKNITGRVRGSHHPLQFIPKITNTGEQGKERERERKSEQK